MERHHLAELLAEVIPKNCILPCRRSIFQFLVRFLYAED